MQITLGYNRYRLTCATPTTKPFTLSSNGMTGDSFGFSLGGRLHGPTRGRGPAMFPPRPPALEIPLPERESYICRYIQIDW
jgi:hypothetical protein